MKALVYHGPGRRAWEDVPEPRILEPTPTRSSVWTP